MGLVIQNLSTFIACFALALATEPILALVTLSTIPLVVLVQIITQSICSPLYTVERRSFAEASTNVERATNAITTVKAHNAQKSELERFDRVADGAKSSLVTQAMVWAISISMTDFFLLGTFVVGFWYGAKVVRDGKADAGTVMTVFWACLLAASFLQMVVPQLSMVTKGKNSMASLRSVIRSEAVRPPSISNPFSPVDSSHNLTFSHDLKSETRIPQERLRPTKCRGDFDLQNVCFAYPSRPEHVVLKEITLFLPEGETTFIVGGSGSGKSTIAQLLLRLYNPNGGGITLDDQPFPILEDGFTQQNIAAVQQGCILFDMSVHENVAMGRAGAGPDPLTGRVRTPKDVTQEEVIEACKMAMIHDFIVNLPDGYETNLGVGGSALSGGQRQRLAIARARIRDPTVLILDEATSALDATSRVIVFENLKQWRKNRTTIVITHDLSQIVADDFVYVMKDGVVAEQGFRMDLISRRPLSGQLGGIFATMAAEQAIEPLPAKVEEWRDRPEDEEVLAENLETPRTQPYRPSPSPTPDSRPHTPSFGIPGRESLAYFNVLDGYSRGDRLSVTPNAKRTSMEQKRLSSTHLQYDLKRTSRVSLVQPDLAARDDKHLESPISLGLTVPTRVPSRLSTRSPGLVRPNSRVSFRESMDREEFLLPYLQPSPPSRQIPLSTEKEDERVATTMRYSYLHKTMSQNFEDEYKDQQDLGEVIEDPIPGEGQRRKRMGILRLLFHFLPSMPNKLYLFLGLTGAIGHGVSTPAWSFFLAKLMTIVGTGGTDPDLTKFGLIVLAICAAQAFADWAQQYFLYALAAMWTGSIRTKAFQKVLAQDKSWYDKTQNSPARLVQCLIKDADDMRQLIGSVVGKFCVFVVMVGLGIVWAMIIDYRLTLIGLALAPVFAAIILLNNGMIGKAEVRNKARREAVARTFYDVSMMPIFLSWLIETCDRASRISAVSGRWDWRGRSENVSKPMRRLPNRQVLQQAGSLPLAFPSLQACHFLPSVSPTSDKIRGVTDMTGHSPYELGWKRVHAEGIPQLCRDASSLQSCALLIDLWNGDAGLQ